MAAKSVRFARRTLVVHRNREAANCRIAGVVACVCIERRRNAIHFHEYTLCGIAHAVGGRLFSAHRSCWHPPPHALKIISKPTFAPYRFVEGGGSLRYVYLPLGFLALALTSSGALPSEDAKKPAADPPKASDARKLPADWAYHAPKRPELPDVKNKEWVRNDIDRFILARLEKEGLTTVPGGGSHHADSPPQSRPDWPAADAGGGGCISRRQERQGVREAGGSAAGVAALRRALGPALARRRPLRRHRRLREGQAAPRLVLPRLGHQRPQPRPALRPVHHRADRRRPAAERRRRTRSSRPASCATR